MFLEEAQLNLVNETYDSFEHKKMDKETLQEWFRADDSAFGTQVRDIRPEIMENVTKMAQLQEKFINETNFSANIASFVPKLQPLLRRIVPQLIAFDIAGVQPVSAPTSEIFMLKAQYAGTTSAPANVTTSVILAMTGKVVAKGDVLTSASGAKGTVIYVEADSSKAVVNVTAGVFVAGEEFDIGATFTNDGNEGTVTAIYSNELGFKQILPGYSGSYTTATSETLGAEINQIRVTIVKQSVTVKSRKLKAELTIELIKDIQAMHGVSAQKEIMFFLETEIVNDINQEVINKYKEIAINESNFAVATFATSAGRHAMEMYSGLYDRILKDKINLSARNRRGAGNIVIATAGVISALMSLDKFADIKSVASVKTGENHATNYVGTLKDGTKVYQDWFASAEYYLVIYKGAGAYDAGVVYSPYTAIEMLEAQNYLTFQPVLGIHTRYALSTNSLLSENGSDYCSLRMVDFTGTPLLG